MDIDLARTMIRTAFESGRTLQAILPALEQGLPPETYRACAHELASAIDQTNTALITRALAAHPALQAEVDTAIKAQGRY
ncbi:hypothetical protein [Devosia neptuniae]|jgi:hypothetical protein|uniref:hypothetical protein n=1 Tax=Devosia TaxID=46913 RepID=UPI0022AECBE8|nr:hypothetical protein [Devosia neptuniae]MCZ4345703.1 hypothetical protein [Devosia neptuniae]|tara:strand:- start:2224 stop:2463 length:240 start_codon:yes stop_codon:yes gene_type:complete